MNNILPYNIGSLGGFRDKCDIDCDTTAEQQGTEHQLWNVFLWDTKV